MSRSAAVIVRLYRNENRSLKEIAEITGMNRESVRRLLISRDVAMRRPGPARGRRSPAAAAPAAVRNVMRPHVRPGTVWCDQCDRKVPEAKALACASPFCNAEVAR